MLALLMLSTALANPPAAPAAPEAEAEVREVIPPRPTTGTVIFEARVPAQIVVGGQILGQLFTPGRLEVSVPTGLQDLAVVREGKPEELEIHVPEAGAAVVVVGRTGTTVSEPEPPKEPADPDAPSEIEVRVATDEALQLRLGRSRYDLNSGEILKVALPRGKHPISVRSARGTVIWVQGTLNVRGEHVILQLSEGRSPEITGEASLISDAR